MGTAIAIIVAIAILAPLAWIAFSIDDWSRDLTTNRAATQTDAEHPLMRPLAQPFTIEQLDAVLASLCQDTPAWSLPKKPKPLPADSLIERTADEPPLAIRHLVRATSLLRFRDDIWIVVEPAVDRDNPDKRYLHIESRSRLGKGDLGQNPRNVRELNQYLLAQLIVKAPRPTKM